MYAPWKLGSWGTSMHFHSHSHYVLILSQFFAMKAFVLRQDMLQVSQPSSFLTCFPHGSIVTLGKGMLGGLVSPRVAYPFSYWIPFGQAEPTSPTGIDRKTSPPKARCKTVALSRMNMASEIPCVHHPIFIHDALPVSTVCSHHSH